MSIQNNDISKLPDDAPVILTWVPRTIGKMPPEEYIKILNEKKEMVAPRKIKLFINGPGFFEGQIDELKEKLSGIDVIDLHDKQYDKSWKKIDQGFKIDGKPFSIKEYFSNGMYEKNKYDRIFFAITIDTFRYIASCFLLEQQKDQAGLIYTDFDVLRDVESIAKNIPIPDGLRANVGINNDVFMISDNKIIKEIIDSYKFRLISQKSMAHKVGANINELYTLPHKLIVLHNIAQIEFLAGSEEFCARSGLAALDGIQLMWRRNISDARFSDGSWKKVQANPELCAAIKTKNFEWLKELLEKTDRCDVTDESGKHITELAVETGKLEIIKLLHSHGAFKNYKKPLEIAVEKDYTDIAKFLIKNDLCILYKERPEYFSDKTTSEHGDEYEKNAKGEISEYWDKYVENARKVADSIHNNDIDGLRDGLKCGVNPKLRCEFWMPKGSYCDDDEGSITDISMREKNIKMAKLIIEKYGVRPSGNYIYYIHDLPGGNEYIKSLIECGTISVDSCSRNESLLFTYVEKDNLEMVKFLLDNRADPFFVEILPLLHRFPRKSLDLLVDQLTQIA